MAGSLPIVILDKNFICTSPPSLQESQYELEQLTKELRQVNLQQFIQQTGTKVTVLPVEPSDEDSSNTTESRGSFLLLIQPKSHPIPIVCK